MITSGQTIIKQNKSENIFSQLKLGPASVKLLTIVLFIALALFYLAQTTQGATKTYEINNLNNEKTGLDAEKEQLEIEASKAKALQKIDESATANQLQPVKEIESLDSIRQ